MEKYNICSKCGKGLGSKYIKIKHFDDGFKGEKKCPECGTIKYFEMKVRTENEEKLNNLKNVLDSDDFTYSTPTIVQEPKNALERLALL